MTPHIFTFQSLYRQDVTMLGNFCGADSRNNTLPVAPISPSRTSLTVVFHYCDRWKQLCVFSDRYQVNPWGRRGVKCVQGEALRQYWGRRAESRVWLVRWSSGRGSAAGQDSKNRMNLRALSWSLLQLSQLIETKAGSKELHWKDNGWKRVICWYLFLAIFHRSWNVFLLSKLIILDYIELQSSLSDIQREVGIWSLAL